jgi:hypothetical protein
MKIVHNNYYIIYLMLFTQLVSCSIFGPNEKDLIEAVKQHLSRFDTLHLGKYAGFTETNYNITVINIKKAHDIIHDYKYIGWVSVTQIRSGRTLKLQFEFDRESSKWRPTDEQLEIEMRELKTELRGIKKLQDLLNK